MGQRYRLEAWWRRACSSRIRRMVPAVAALVRMLAPLNSTLAPTCVASFPPLQPPSPLPPVLSQVAPAIAPSP